MTRIALLLLVALPALARADDVWRWTDNAGHVHYSNVPGHVPAHAASVQGTLGYLSGTEPAAEAGETPLGIAPAARLTQERKIRRRLAEIETFYRDVRARQVARLLAYGQNSTLLPDWLVADRWLQMKEEEERLRAALADLERPARPPS